MRVLVRPGDIFIHECAGTVGRLHRAMAHRGGAAAHAQVLVARLVGQRCRGGAQREQQHRQRQPWAARCAIHGCGRGVSAFLTNHGLPSESRYRRCISSSDERAGAAPAEYGDLMAGLIDRPVAVQALRQGQRRLGGGIGGDQLRLRLRAEAIELRLAGRVK